MIKIPTTHFDKRGNHYIPFDKMVCTRSEKDVLRGIYFQPGQERWVTVALGEIYHVIVDMHTKAWTAHRLSEKKHEVLHVPEGYAHGYRVLSETAIVFSHLSIDDREQQFFRFDEILKPHFEVT